MNRIAQYCSVSIIASLLLTGCNWVYLASRGNSGEPLTTSSFDPQLSDDGRFLVYASNGFNLRDADPNNPIPIDPNNPPVFDPNNPAPYDPNEPWPSAVYIHDSLSGTTANVSVTSAGEIAGNSAGGAALSGDGRFIAFHSEAANLVEQDTNGAVDVFVHDLQTHETHRVSINSQGDEGDLDSFNPSISDNGDRIAFSTRARNFSPIDTATYDTDVYVHERSTGTTTLISISSEGVKGFCCSQQAVISGDGRYVAFESFASNLVADDTNSAGDVFLHDMVTSTTMRVSLDSSGDQINRSSRTPALSDDGRFVTFSTSAALDVDDTDLYTDVYVRDTVLGTTTLASGSAPYGIVHNSISDDGRYIAFSTSLLFPPPIPGEVNNVFVYDQQTDSAAQVSLNYVGQQANGHSSWPALAGNGRYIAFNSMATNLSSSDGNGTTSDLFIRALPNMFITSIQPDTLVIGATTAVTITGQGFLPGTGVYSGITYTNVVVVDENTITLDMTVPASAAAGSQDVAVFLLGGAPGPLTGAAAKCAGCLVFKH